MSAYLLILMVRQSLGETPSYSFTVGHGFESFEVLLVPPVKP